MMLKLLLFFALILAAALGFAHVADTPGHVLLQFGETEFRVSLVTALAALLVSFIGLTFLWSLIRFVFRLPSLIGLANRMRRREKGQLAVARGLVAIGVGDQKQAQRHAADSERLLGSEPLTLLLKAQAAQLSGDSKSAELAFKSMLDKPETQGLGLRGLFIEAERRGDTSAARALAGQAYARNPGAAWANEAVLRQFATAGNWSEAIGVIEQGLSRRLIDREEGRRQRAVLLAAAAEESLENAPDEALALAQEALRLRADLVPAVVIAARRLSARGDYGKATRIIETAWKSSPHPDLAEAYLAVRQGDSALDRLKRARALEKLSPNERESRFAVARAAMDAREYSVAREALEALVLQKATARACLMMAELEDRESGNQGLVRSWLSRASRAPRDPAWVADGTVSDHWKPVSPVTGAIGAFRWEEPPQAHDVAIRARIDADRFENPPPAVLPLDASPVLDIAPAPDSTTVEPPTNEAATPTMPANAVSDPEPPRPIEEVIRPFIPDDPGPDPDQPPPRRRFRLFG